MNIRIVVPVFRAARWVRRCLRSIQRQTRDFRCVIRDDGSDDGTFERIHDAVGADARFVVQRSATRLYPLGNMVAGIRAIATDPEDVVVTVDGDDWLRHRRVLERLARVYADDQVWLTYGSHQRWKPRLLHRIGWTVRRGIAAPYAPEVHEARSYRTAPYVASHLRTFRRFLFDAIREEDLRDADGAYYRVAGDVAHMIPMLEMAGPAHTRYIHEMLYVYNNSNPSSEHRRAAQDVRDVVARLAALPPYAALKRGGRGTPD